MSARQIATGAALALAGLLAAVGIGLLANTISGDSVGLSAEPLSAGETLAPAGEDRQDGRERRRPRAGRESDERAAPRPTTSTPAPPPTTTSEDETEDGEGDGQSRGRGRGRSGGDSGSGSGESGSDSDDDD